jgi:hypothetical protein
LPNQTTLACAAEYVRDVVSGLLADRYRRDPAPPRTEPLGEPHA